MLNGVDKNTQPKEYRKKVDIIDIEKVDSTLTVQEYITFYAMVIGIYSKDTIEEMKALLVENGLGHTCNISINKLNNLEKIKVRCIAAYMKQISCLVGKGLLDGLDKGQRELFIIFLTKYFVKDRCLCLLFDHMEQQELEEFDKGGQIWLIR